jgi:hypothetical protein
MTVRKQDIDTAFRNAHTRAKTLHETMLVVEGAGGYYSCAQSWYFSQDDKDRIVARVYQSGQELWTGN